MPGSYWALVALMDNVQTIGLEIYVPGWRPSRFRNLYGWYYLPNSFN